MRAPITTDEVVTQLKMTAPDEHLPIIVAAVNAMVDQWHGDRWPAGAHYGAIMLAARLHRRRNSPAGVESFSEMGASYVSRYDTDLDRLLEINSWSPPRVG